MFEQPLAAAMQVSRWHQMHLSCNNRSVMLILHSEIDQWQRMRYCHVVYDDWLAMGTAAGSKGTVRQARRVQSVLYECGPHFGCAEGSKCSQAATLMVNTPLFMHSCLHLVSHPITPSNTQMFILNALSLATWMLHVQSLHLVDLPMHLICSAFCLPLLWDVQCSWQVLRLLRMWI